MLSPLEELRFWTGIMRDHGEFILTSLSYNEHDAICCANFFKESFLRLHEQSEKISKVNGADLNSILNQSMSTLLSFINFKRLLLRRSLQCQLNSSLPPTFFNHMINEAMQFCKTILNIRCNIQVNTLEENLNLHKIWLPDAAGHAATIASELDPTEKPLIIEAEEFEKYFNNLTLKVGELSKMLVRTCLTDGALKQLNQDVMKKIKEFICYLNKIRELLIACKVLGVLKPLIPDHMIREEIYYLNRIATFR